MTKNQHFSSNGTCTIWTNGILAFDEQTQLPNAICTLKNIRQFFSKSHMYLKLLIFTVHKILQLLSTHADLF